MIGKPQMPGSLASRSCDNFTFKLEDHIFVWQKIPSSSYGFVIMEFGLCQQLKCSVFGDCFLLSHSLKTLNTS